MRPFFSLRKQHSFRLSDIVIYTTERITNITELTVNERMYLTINHKECATSVGPDQHVYPANGSVLLYKTD